MGFSDYLNFNAWKHICVQECSFRWKFSPIVNPLGICFCLFFKYHLLSPKLLAQRNFYCNSRKFYPSYVQHATNCWISCILPSFFSLFHTFSKLHSKLFIDKPNVRSNFLTNARKKFGYGCTELIESTLRIVKIDKKEVDVNYIKHVAFFCLIYCFLKKKQPALISNIIKYTKKLLC